MMRAIVALDDEEFDVPAVPDPFNSESIDFTPTIAAAFRARAVKHPLAEPLNLETLVVSVRRGGTEDRNPDVKVQLDRVGRTLRSEPSQEPASPDVSDERPRKRNR